MKKAILLIVLLSIFQIAVLANSEYENLHQYVKKAKRLKLSDKIQWARLLHYHSGVFSGYESQVDAKFFFLSPDGKNDMDAELLATIKDLLNSEIAQDDTHPICRFPARLKWLDKYLNFRSDLPKVTCKKFDHFLTIHGAKSISLVFSSYHLQSPASAYGHTLMRINKGNHAKTGKHHELLDFGINYAANMTSTNPIVYAVMGIIGGFKGTFSSIPYFYKIREYNDFESRDLWSYNLDLSQDEIAMLMAHLWELGNVYFDYFYFTENCSYHMLSALEAVNPKWNLLETLPFYVVPIETVKALFTVPGLVKSVDYRASGRTNFWHSLAQLDPVEVDVVKRTIRDVNLEHLDGLKKRSRAKVLDTVIDFLDYKYSGEILLRTGPKKLWKETLLQERSTLPIKGVDSKVPAPLDDAPHLSHGQHRADFSFGDSEKHGAFATASMRFSYHDILDPQRGMPKSSNLEMFKFRFRYNKRDSRLLFDDFTFADVSIINPWTEFNKGMSFTAKIGGETFNQGNCHQCFAPVARFGSGLAFSIGSRVTAALLFDAGIAVQKRFHRSWTNIQLGPHLNFYINWHDKLVSNISGVYYLLPTNRYNIYWVAQQETRFHISSLFSIVLKNRNLNQSWEHSLGINFFF